MAVLKTPAGTWEVRYRVDGRQRQKTFRKYRDARAFDEKTKTQLRDGDYVPPSDVTVTEVVEKWLEAGKPRWKEQTYLAAKTHLEKYIRPRFSETKATSLRAVDVEIAGAEWEKLVSAPTVNKIYGTMGAAYKFARKKLDVRSNPMPDVDRRTSQVTPEELEAQAVLDRGTDDPGTESGKLRSIGADEVYSAAELRRIIEAATPGLERALLMTEVFTGLRHGELNALRWATLNLKNGKLTVNRSLTELKGGPVLERPKTRNAYRSIQLPAELVSELRQWKLRCPQSPNGFVFADELGRPMHRKSNNRMLARCCERAEVRVLSMNNLRHTYASVSLTARTPLLEVSKLMGHSKPDVTLKLYARWAETEESTAAAMLASRILGTEESQGQQKVNMT